MARPDVPADEWFAGLTEAGQADVRRCWKEREDRLQEQAASRKRDEARRIEQREAIQRDVAAVLDGATILTAKAVTEGFYEPRLVGVQMETIDGRRLFVSAIENEDECERPQPHGLRVSAWDKDFADNVREQERKR